MHIRPWVPNVLVIGTLLFATSACLPATPAPATQQTSGGQTAQAPAGGQPARGGATLRRPGAGGAAQGPGNLTRLAGTVQMVLPEGVWLADGKNFGMTAATRVTRGTPKQLSDLRAGEFVNVTSERLADGSLQAKEVNQLSAQEAPGGQQRQGGQGTQNPQGQPTQGGQAAQGQGGSGNQRRTAPADGSTQQGQNPTSQQRGGQGASQGGAGGQAPAPSAAAAPAQGGAPGGGRGGQQAERTLADGSVVVIGTLESVEAGAVIVTAGGTQVRIAVSATTTVVQRATAAAADLVPGVSITALLSDGDAVTVNLQ